MPIRKTPVTDLCEKTRAPRNRTLDVSDEERHEFRRKLRVLRASANAQDILDSTVCQDLFEVLPLLPDAFVDLLFVDPPYNLHKSFNGRRFKKMATDDYMHWVDSWLAQLVRILKSTASVYICSDWRSTPAVQLVAERYFKVRNRITWEREKGRGAKSNWKNCSEDILFCTLSDDYVFEVDAVRLKRRVIAPYTRANGDPKDWDRTSEGNYRLTHPSNLWTDLTVPFWSMPENTDHPAQKPEKLLAKIILASSKVGDVVLDPFAGSGTTAVVARKLRRHFVGIEIDERFCCLAEKRLALAQQDTSIQGYHDAVFWERNTLREQNRMPRQSQHSAPDTEGCLFAT